MAAACASVEAIMSTKTEVGIQDPSGNQYCSSFGSASLCPTLYRYVSSGHVQSCILRGDDSQGEFYSIAIANNMQQADTGTKMVHLGKNTKSRIVSKGISAGKAQNTYRGLVSMHPRAKNSRNYTQCDSLLIGDQCGAHTVPYIEVKNNSSRVEHEATTSKVDDDQLFYCRSRGMDEEEAVALVVNGFCKEVLQALPMEFAMEAQALVAISLEGSVG